MDGHLPIKASAYNINRDELGMPSNFLKLLLQISCSYSDKNLY